MNEQDGILQKIEAEILKLVIQISEEKPPYLSYNSRTSWENIIFEEDVGLQMKNDCKTTVVRFDSIKSVKKFSVLVKVLSLMYQLIQTDKYCTKRDLYYQDTTGFGSQKILDEAVDSISCMLQIPRWKLHVLATSKGCVAGDLTFQDQDGNFVDCSATKDETNAILNIISLISCLPCSSDSSLKHLVNIIGVLVPTNVNSISNLHTEAKVILVIEKDATFQKLLDYDICQKLKPCIVITILSRILAHVCEFTTGKGFPDINTRMLLNKIWKTFHIPVMALVDADPHGIEIMAIYKYGSRSLSFETPHLAVPGLHWMGVLPSDINRLGIRETALIELTKSDWDKMSELRSRPYFRSSSSLDTELQIMSQMGKKAEIQCLDSISPAFLMDVYIPGKLQYGGWI